ncbi:hypothetical protein [Micromonospora tulbaghiae]|uniref:hypothetical protein n=1 Tax=Micromonospora tulbaghiae TaxID=479978 RepID=UPI0033E4A813
MLPELVSPNFWTPTLLVLWAVIVGARQTVRLVRELVKLVLGLVLIVRANRKDLPAIARSLFDRHRRR